MFEHLFWSAGRDLEGPGLGAIRYTPQNEFYLKLYSELDVEDQYPKNGVESKFQYNPF